MDLQDYLDYRVHQVLKEHQELLGQKVIQDLKVFLDLRDLQENFHYSLQTSYSKKMIPQFGPNEKSVEIKEQNQGHARKKMSIW
jgi:hypothetical protein